MNKGASQKTRIRNELKEQYISLDERSLLDLMNFTLDFSRHIKFYDLHNEASADWKSFLVKDSAFVIALIAKSDFSGFMLDSKYTENPSGKTNLKKIVKNRIKRIIYCISEWAELVKISQYNGVLFSDIKQIYTVSIGLKQSIEQNNQGVEFLKEAYDTLFETIVFIREKARNNFEKEILDSQSHAPHIGLLISFFKLFRYLQNDINSLTGKHLDYYYLNILQQKKKKPEPVSAIVELKPLPGTGELTINEGAICEFGFEGNLKLNFVTNSDNQINQAKITDMITLFKSDDYPFHDDFEEDNFSLNVLYEEEIVREGKNVRNFEFTEKDELPLTLGEVQKRNSGSESYKRLSNIGIVVSSPVLFLEKGKHKIELIFKITPSSYKQALSKLKGLVKQEIKEEADKARLGSNQPITDEVKIKKRVLENFVSKAFLLFITNNKGWKKIEYFNVVLDSDEHSLIFNIELDEQTEQLCAMDNAIHSGEFKTEWPCIKLLLNNNTQYHPYKVLKDFVMEYVVIKAHVENVENFELSNTSGAIDGSIPFMPFGPIPVVGSYLQIQNPLIFQKNLSELSLLVNWSGLPQEADGFKDYYRAYPNQIDNSSFKAILTQNKNSLNLTGKTQPNQFSLFSDNENNLKNSVQIPVSLHNFNFKFRIDPGRINSDSSVSPVFLVLVNPPMAFGHQVFTQIYASAALKNSRFRRRQSPLPNQPFTPVIERLSVTYSNLAKEVMQRKQEERGSDIKIIHLLPFGHVQTFPGPVKSQSYFLPQIENNGHLFIGLSDVNPGDLLNIGFELDPAIYISTVINAPEISWQFLLNNEWEPFGDLFLEDTTHNLIKSGIIKIKIPNNIQFDNTWLPSGKFWIRAVCKGSEILNSRIKNVFTQAVLLVSSHADAENQLQILPNQKIEKISFSGLKGIGKISGPFAFGINQAFEDDESFYSRISEQLRHKNRAISNWDVERIILAKFRGIDKVRVYGRNNYARNLIKGSTMQIVLIPKNNSEQDIGKRNNKLDFYTLNTVKEYISKFVSPYTNVEVSNPVYEHLKVKCRVKLTDFQKRGTLLHKLNNELISYLSPDIETPEMDKGFGESISKTEILNFIESRPYVDFVTEFSVLQLVEVQGRYKIIDTAVATPRKTNIEELRTISPYAILTSAPMHQIEIIQEINSLPMEISGFGDLSIEYDFVISDKGDYN